MEHELSLCPHCGDEIEGAVLSYNEVNKALHFEMDHGDVVCHFDLEFSPVLLNTQFEGLLRIFQRSRSAAPMVSCR